jgi:hypothetical protein
LGFGISIKKSKQNALQYRRLGPDFAINLC